MRHLAIVASAAVLATLLSVRAASAQGSNFALVDATSAGRLAGWTFTPSLVYQGAWDDNALLVFDPDPPSDFLSLVNPRADVNFLGRRGEFDATYDGAFFLYRNLNALNSYDQHATVAANRWITPHVSLWARNTFASVPTTELLNFVAVPFVRTGSKLDDLRGGIEATLTKFTTITGGYNFQWVAFDDMQPAGSQLRGGHSHGGSVALKHLLSDTTSLVAVYNIQHALIGNGGTFDVQNADAGIEQMLSPQTRVFGAFGFSRLGVNELGPSRTGPSWRAGLTHRFKETSVGASYSRSYVPAFAFGGTYENEELVGRVHVPLARRVYAQSSFSWRRNEPLEREGLKLSSFWLESTIGYALQPWVEVQAFFSGAHQDIDRPGGNIGRRRIGFQIVTRKPVRVR